MKEKITKILGITLGVILLIFGLNKGLNFFSPPPPPESALSFWGGIVSCSFILPTVMVVEILAGLSLIFGRFVKLSLLMMLPITYGILMYHIIYDISGGVIPAVIVIIQSYLIYKNRKSYKNLLS